MTHTDQAIQIGELVLEQDQKRKLCFSLQIKLRDTGAIIKRFGEAVSRAAETASLAEIPILDTADIQKSVEELREVQERVQQINGHLKKLGL